VSAARRGPFDVKELLSAAFFVIGLASTAQAEETFGHQEVDHCGDVDRKGHRASGVIPFVILRRDPPLGTGSARLAGRQATGRLGATARRAGGVRAWPARGPPQPG